MKNTVNIFEELNKMKNLIHVKRGTVISEQMLNSAGQPIQSQSQTSNELTSNQQLVSSKGFGSVPSQEADLLVKLGNITQQSSFDSSQISSLRDQVRKELATLRQKNINSNYCSVVNGKIEGANLAHKGKTFKWYVDMYKVTRQEVETAKQTCPNVVVPDPFAPVGPTPTQRLATTAKSLGVENPQMDVATLQKILDTLNASSGAVTESKKSVNEELNTIKYLLGYQRGRVISEQDAATQSTPTPKDLITQIQTVLKDKFNQNLGPTGADGKWGNYSQTALENALKTAAETKQKADELSQRRAAETQQTATQDAAIQQAVDQGNQNIKSDNLQLQSANTQGVQTPDLYTTLVNNKTLVTRPNGNIVYRGADLTSTQRQELETKLQTMGYNLSTDQRDKTYGDKLVFKKNQ